MKPIIFFAAALWTSLAPSMPKPNVPFSPHAQASDILIPAQLQTVSTPR